MLSQRLSSTPAWARSHPKASTPRGAESLRAIALPSPSEISRTPRSTPRAAQSGDREPREEDGHGRSPKEGDPRKELVENPPDRGMGSKSEEESYGPERDQKPPKPRPRAPHEGDHGEKQRNDPQVLVVGLEDISPPVCGRSPLSSPRIVADEFGDHQADSFLGVEGP